MQDKNAVEAYSTLDFYKIFNINQSRSYGFRKDKDYIGVKVIKKNGKEQIINIEKEAIKDQENYKLAIPNLEVGDILDFYHYKDEAFLTNGLYSFSPVSRTLSERYPVLNLKLHIDTRNDFFVNFKSLNGAPKLKLKPSNKRNYFIYEFQAKDIDKADFPNWFYPLLELPSIKMQVYYALSPTYEERIWGILPEDEGIIKSSVKKEELLDFFEKRLNRKEKLPAVKDYLKGKTFKSNEEKVKSVYYYLRYYFLTQYVERIYAIQANIIPNTIYSSSIIESDYVFVRYFAKFLDLEGIPFEIYLNSKRYNGDIKDMIILANTDLTIKIKTKNPIYASVFSPHRPISYIDPLHENTNAYTFSKSKQKGLKYDIIGEAKNPVSVYTDNETLQLVDLTLNENFTGFNVKMKTKRKGHNKTSAQYSRMYYYDYINEDYKKYKGESFINSLKSKKYRAKVSNEMKALADKLKKRQKEYFENQTKSDFDLTEIEDYAFKITNTGRFDFSDYFTYDESFKFNNKYIKKAGPNYIIEIGKFIGSQIEIEEKNRKRDANIYMSNPRMYNSVIVLNIPQGYKVVGLDKLQKNVNNGSGAFISTAKIEDGKLIITTSKQYKSNFYTKDKWPEILAFLDEANQFTNEKVLLKKQ